MAAEIPETMRAAQLKQYGLEKDNFVVNSIPVPEIKANEVLIEVHAAAPNPVDYKMARGDMKLVSPKTPYTLGFDVSGVVVKVGDACKRLKVGDKVFSDTGNRGSFAEYVAANEANVVTMPTNVDFLTAAGVPLAALTALQGLRDYCNAMDGSKVLVLGGSGGVGSFAVQIGKALGAYVAATASQVDLVKGLGADQVINYKEQNWGEVLKGQNYDAIFDCVGGADSWEAAQSVLAPKGMYCTIVGDENDAALTMGNLAGQGATIMKRKLMNILGKGPNYALFLTNAAATKDLEYIRDLMEQNKLRAVVDPTPPFALETVYELFEKQASHRAKGKLLLKVRD